MFFPSRVRVSAALFGRLADLHPTPPFPFHLSTTLVSSQGQLTDAVAREDFTEAASLKRTIKHMRQNCPVFAVERGYRAAVREEDYAAAASFRDQGAGLVGWWCGRGETEDEPGGQYGVMMQITPEHGRYVGRSYSARDLAAMQERARRDRSSSRRKDRSLVASEVSHVDDDDENVGVGVFELWLEKDSDTGEMRRRAVRVDHFPAGALDGDDSFASVDDDAVPSRDKERSSASGNGFAAALGGFPLSGPIEPGTEFGTERSNDGDDGDVSSRTRNAFAGWRVSNGAVRVSRGETSADASVSLGSNPNPFPFDVDGVSMEELLSYERQGFMAEFKNTPGFAETWARLKAEHAASESETETEKTERLSERLAAAPSEGDPDVFEAFGGKGARRPGASRREPHDEYFFEKYVINETDGDAGVVDLDDLEAFDDDDDAFDLEKALSDDDDDDDDDGFVVDLDAAAAALLDGGRGRIDRAAKGLPAAMVADIQRAIEARGMGRAVFPDDGDDDEDDPWAVEEVRIPVEMAADGHHAFRVWSEEDDDDDDDARASGAVPGSIPALERTLREASATEADIETTVLRGLSDAKARVAEELRRAAKDAAEARDAPKTPEKGETETVAVNFDTPGRIEPGTGAAGGASSDESDASKTSAEEKRAAFDAPDAPSTLGGDAAAMRFGATGSAASVFGAGEAKESTKSKGERFFERLVSSSADNDEDATENVEAEDSADDADGTDAGTEAANGSSRRKDVVPPRGFISPASFESRSSDGSDVDDASRRLEEEAASALMEALGGDADALPLPGRTRFSRVPESVASRSSSDPFDRLYLGAFGPHGPEVLRLVRGRWGDERGAENNCVTAVKLTGDANVPAGAASFRARVGPGDALDSSFSYPEELGVVTRFKGQGRVAKPGFAERNWVDGELLLLDGRGGQLTGGAELGFVWAVPGERRLLILFSSLELPETTSGSMVLD